MHFRSFMGLLPQLLTSSSTSVLQHDNAHNLTFMKWLTLETSLHSLHLFPPDSPYRKHWATSILLIQGSPNWSTTDFHPANAIAFLASRPYRTTINLPWQWHTVLTLQPWANTDCIGCSTWNKAFPASDFNMFYPCSQAALFLTITDPQNVILCVDVLLLSASTEHTNTTNQNVALQLPSNLRSTSFWFIHSEPKQNQLRVPCP